MGSLTEASTAESESVVRNLRGWLNVNHDWLLIADGADHPEELVPYLPHSGNGHVLITSRTATLDCIGAVDPIDLHLLSPQESTDFLVRRVGARQYGHVELTAIEQLGKALGYLALALEQAGAFIAAKQSRFQDYLLSFRQRELELLDSALPATGDYPASVTTTWSLNFEEIEFVSKASAQLLKSLAFLASDDIPLELLVYGFSELPEDLKQALVGAIEIRWLSTKFLHHCFSSRWYVAMCSV